MPPDPTAQRDAERLLRLAMSVTLLTAGVSKLLSRGAFAAWYAERFRAPELRIHLPGPLVDGFLELVPFVEIGIGLGLLHTPWKRTMVHLWCAFFVSIEFGHYVLEEWSAVNEMIPYLLLGAVCLVLPAHPSLVHRDPR